MLVILSLVATSAAYAQAKRYPGTDPPKRPSKPPVPRGSRKPAVKANGVLFVFTQPETASVVVKNSQGETVSKGVSRQGEYRIELKPGKYNIEVEAAKYLASTFETVVKQAQPEYVLAELTPSTGAVQIAMGTLPETAAILIDDSRPAKITRKSGNQVFIDDVDIGSHTLRITHPTIADYEEKIEVQGGIITPVTPDFKEAVVSFIVRSEPGADIFIDNNLEGRVGERGELRVSTKYKPGRHTIRAEKEKYRPAQKSEEFSIGEAVVELKLTRATSLDEFADYFLDGAIHWEAPKNWDVKRGRMTVRGSEIGLLRDRIYDDFKMVFDVSFANGKGAVWILRAQDKQNYYLFQLTGPRASAPNTLRYFAYQNGQPRLLGSVPVVENLGTPGDSFTITVEAKGPVIKHYIQVKSAPKASGPELISTVTDTIFSYGGVGFGAKDGEEFTVFLINVIPQK
ncbi:MAG TPA: carboxypeptidase-like regulatory domain-containing protein [Blastocatellia bacterium]|nr:carboxypeptidase-like regulatory domain-containing protein [Blastocatellia bacterium]